MNRQTRRHPVGALIPIQYASKKRILNNNVPKKGRSVSYVTDRYKRKVL